MSHYAARKLGPGKFQAVKKNRAHVEWSEYYDNPSAANTIVICEAAKDKARRVSVELLRDAKGEPY